MMEAEKPLPGLDGLYLLSTRGTKDCVWKDFEAFFFNKRSTAFAVFDIHQKK